MQRGARRCVRPTRRSAERLTRERRKGIAAEGSILDTSNDSSSSQADTYPALDLKTLQRQKPSHNDRTMSQHEALGRRSFVFVITDMRFC
jgi:hypothetical protein